LIREPHSKRRLIANVLLAGAILVCTALFIDPPGYANFWPACPIHQLLGFECPGCGSTRALAALLHGHLRDAMRLNALFTLLLPLGIVAAIRTYRRAIRPGAFHWPQPSRAAIYSAVAASFIFTIARNIVR
jgi:hypothetical protein